MLQLVIAMVPHRAIGRPPPEKHALAPKPLSRAPAFDPVTQIKCWNGVCRRPHDRFANPKTYDPVTGMCLGGCRGTDGPRERAPRRRLGEDED